MRRTVTLLAVLSVACSCYRWEPHAVSPGGAAVPDAATLRLTRPDGSQLVLRQAEVVNDSVHGLPDGSRRSLERHAESLSDIHQLEVRAFNGPATAYILLGVALVVVGAGVAAAQIASGINN